MFSAACPMPLCKQCVGGHVHIFLHAPLGRGRCWASPLRGLRGVRRVRGPCLPCECVRAMGIRACLLQRGPLIVRGVFPCHLFPGGDHLVVAPAAAAARSPPGDHAFEARWQVVLRASVKHRLSHNIPRHVVSERAACCYHSLEPPTNEA